MLKPAAGCDLPYSHPFSHTASSTPAGTSLGIPTRASLAVPVPAFSPWGSPHSALFPQTPMPTATLQISPLDPTAAVPALPHLARTQESALALTRWLAGCSWCWCCNNAGPASVGACAVCTRSSRSGGWIQLEEARRDNVSTCWAVHQEQPVHQLREPCWRGRE